MRIAAVLALLLAASPASADDFFQLSPGPLTNAHAELDNTDNCTKCHELGKGVTNFLCLDCHQHQPLRDAIKQKRGLHASFNKDCRTCHADHKGRDSFIVDWGPVGGRQSFKHQQTGFESHRPAREGRLHGLSQAQAQVRSHLLHRRAARLR